MSWSRSLSVIPPRYRRPELISVALVVAIVVGAQLLSTWGHVSPLLLRAPTEVAGELVASAGSPGLRADVLATAYRVAVAFVVCIVLGSIMSLAFWRNDTLRKTFIPILGALFGTPLVLGYMVLVALFGRGDLTIILIATHAVIPMVINGTDALDSVDDVLVDVSRSFNATTWQTLWKVIIPAAAPDIFSGIRIGFTYIMISVTAVEFLLTVNRGLGGRISNLYLRFRMKQLFVALVFIVLLVVVAIFLLRRIEAVIQR